MSEFNTEWILQLKDLISGPFENIAKAAGLLDNHITEIATHTGHLDRAFGGLTEKFFKFNQASQSIGMIKNSLESTIAPGLQFESAMTDMGNITGLTGNALDDLGQRAEKMSATYGGSATEAVEAYTNITNKLGIELAKSPEALSQMGNAVEDLGILMKDKAEAADVLSSSINLFGFNLKTPIEQAQLMTQMGNIMYTSMREGSAKINQVGESLREVGAVAKSANVSFNETVAVIQAMGKFGGKFGADAGVGLRNMIGRLQGGDLMRGIHILKPYLDAAGVDIKKLSDMSLPFTERLKELSKVSGNAAVMTRFFGEENIAGARAIMNNLPWVNQLIEKQKQATGVHEAATRALRDNAAKIDIVKAQFEGLLLRMYDLVKVPLSGFFDTLAKGFGWLNEHGRVIIDIIKGIGIALGVTAVIWAAFNVPLILSTAAMWAFNLALAANPVGFVIAGIIALGAALGYLYYKFDIVHRAVNAFWGVTKGLFQLIWDEAKAPLQLLYHAIHGLFTLNFSEVKHAFIDPIKQTANDLINIGTSGVAGWSQGLGVAESKKGSAGGTAQGTMADWLNTVDGGSGDNTKKKKGAANTLQDGMSSVSGGNSSTRNVTVHIAKLIGIENLNTTHIQEGFNNAAEQLKRVLINELRDVELTVANE